jgi:hypothetical protein
MRDQSGTVEKNDSYVITNRHCKWDEQNPQKMIHKRWRTIIFSICTVTQHVTSDCATRLKITMRQLNSISEYYAPPTLSSSS